MALIDFKEVTSMDKKKAVAVLLAAAFSLSLPLFGIADAQAQAPTPKAKVRRATAKSKQAIAAKKPHKGTAKKPVKRVTTHRPTTKRKT